MKKASSEFVFLLCVVLFYFIAPLRKIAIATVSLLWLGAYIYSTTAVGNTSLLLPCDTIALAKANEREWGRFEYVLWDIQHPDFSRRLLRLNESYLRLKRCEEAVFGWSALTADLQVVVPPR